jgi:GTP-binding protein
MINKIDRPDARCHEVLDEIFGLFVELGAHDEQLDFPVVYGSGRDGYAVNDTHEETKDLLPLFDMILKKVPPPPQQDDAPVQFQAATLDHDDFLGRVAIGRVRRGVLKNGARVAVCHPDRDSVEILPIKGLFRYEGLIRVPVEVVHSGDIAVVAGLEGISIGDTLCHPENQDPLPAIRLDEPTISMEFFVSNSPFAGQEGQFVTSRQIFARLERAALRDVALLVTDTPANATDGFEVKGRGVMHLGVLIENMRREGFEFSVGKPRVILKDVEGVRCEPFERTVIEVPNRHAGKVIEYLGKRRGEMINMNTGSDGTRIEFRVPSRGLFGFRNELLTQTRGTGIVHQNLHGYEPYKGEFAERNRGALVAMEAGTAIPYSIFRLQDRGTFFIEPGTKVYAGMVVGENKRNQDMPINVCKTKQLTNVRAVGSDDTVHLEPPRLMSLDQALEWLSTDEYLEVTPESIRIRKRDIRNGKIRPSKAV